MSNLRLFGLVLIITSMFLGLAAMATQTATIRLGLPSSLATDETQPPPNGSDPAASVHFIELPVAYPLAAACLLGCLLWFVPELMGANSSSFSNTRQRKRKKTYK